MALRSIARAGLSAAALLVSMPASSPAQSATGDIQGIVMEQAAGPLAGVSISVTNTGTAAFRVVTSGPDGRFAVPGLPAGTYDVLAMLEGFAAQRQERVTVRVGQTVVSNLELRRAVLPETLTLAEAPSNLEPRHSDASFRIDPIEVEHLPLAERNALDLLALVPGVTPPEQGAPTAGGVGAAYTTIVVDGLTETWPGVHAGPGASTTARPYGWSRLALQEAQVVLSGAMAEYGGGGTLGHIVSRSGSQIFSGRLFEEWRGGALTAATARGEQLGSSAHQFGGALGGPLAPGHVFFAAYDGLRSRHDQEVFLHVPDAQTLSPSVRDTLEPRVSNWTATARQDLLHVRTDHRLGAAGRVTLRYRQIDFDGHDAGDAGPQRAGDAAVPLGLRNRSVAGTTAGRLGSLALNELRVTYAHHTTDTGGRTGVPRADIHSNGALALRTGHHAFDARRRLRHVQLADTAMWSTFRHALRAGGDIEWFEREQEVTTGARGAYVFDSPAQVVGGVPSGTVGRYSQTFFVDGFDALRIRPDSRRVALFVQDKWLVHDTLSIDAGLRYERERWAAPGVTNPDPQLHASGIDTGTLGVDSGSWSPRLGLAWNPASRYVVRAAYSISHSRIPEGLVSSAHAYNGVSARALTLSAGAGAMPSWPDRLSAPPADARPSIVFFDNAFESPRFEHVSAGLEWAWMPSTSVGLTVLHVRGTRLPRAVELNVGAAFPATFTTEDGSVTAPRFMPGPFTAFDRIVQYESTAESRYSGMAMELRRQWGQGVIYRLAYTLGKATDTGPIATPVAFVGPPTARTIAAPAPASIGVAPSDHDSRHRLLATMLVRSDAIADLLGSLLEPVLDDWRAAAVYTLDYGRPYSATVFGDLNADSNSWNDLVPDTTRNEFRTPRIGRLDVRLSRDFPLGGLRLTGSVDVFNVTNSARHRLVDDTLYALEGTSLVRNPLFGERLDQVMPRTIQVGVALGF
jgi:hypothetical protein